MKPVTILKRARKLIDEPEKWARDMNHLSSKTNCALTAITVGGLPAEEIVVGAAEAIFRRVIRNRRIPEWNDAPRRTHRQVLNAFDRAIALAEKGAQS